MRSFECIQVKPMTGLPQNKRECTEMYCCECVMSMFLDDNSCQYASMLRKYKEVV